MVLATSLVGAAWAVPPEEDFVLNQWQEAEISLPPPPDLGRCMQFFVSAASPNRFCVDPASITVGRDGVVRYTLVIETPAGARNVSFEGIRCEARERRLYASGQGDGSWSQARGSNWTKITEASVNRHHAALYLEYFCPDGIPVVQARDAIENLRQGGHRSKVRF